MFKPKLTILTDPMTVGHGIFPETARRLARRLKYAVLERSPTSHPRFCRLLPDEQWRWYWADVDYPLILALAPVALAWQLKPDAMGMAVTLLYLFATYIASLAAVLMGLPAVRRAALETWRLRPRSI